MKSVRPTNQYVIYRTEKRTIFYTVLATSKAEAKRNLREGRNIIGKEATEPTLSVGCLLP